MLATSSTVANRLSSEVGRASEELLLDGLERHAPAWPASATNSRHALRVGRAGQDGVDRDAGPGDRLGEPAGDGELRRLGHAVVDHLHGDLEARLAGDEDDAAPVLPLHAGR